MTTMTETVALTALVLLALHLHTDVPTLIRRYGPQVVLDASGFPSIPTALARAHTDSVRAAQLAAAEESRKRAAAAELPAVRHRVRRLQAQQEALELVDDGALAAMHALDGSQDRKLDAAARARAEMLGQVAPEYHRIEEV
jgi:hypothetical protein